METLAGGRFSTRAQSGEKLMKSAFWSKFFFVMKFITVLVAFLFLFQLPGQVSLIWREYEIEVSVAILSIAFLSIVLTLLSFHRWYLFLRNLPDSLKKRRKQKRQLKAQHALLEGFNALAAEEVPEAKDWAERASRYDASQPLQPLQLLLKTQAAFAMGDQETAEEALEKLRSHPQTHFLGLRGLIHLEDHRQNPIKIHQLLLEALKTRPQSPWVLQKLFEWDLHHARFDQAETMLEQLQITDAVEPKKIARHKALLAWAEADVAYREQDFDAFYESAHRALAFAPDLTEASFRLAQYYAESQRSSKALKVLNNGYAAHPHPDYGVILQQVQTVVSSLDLYKDAEQLTKSHPNHPYTHQILARFAIEAKLWGQAKTHLSYLKKVAPTKSYYQLMAHLETQQHPEQPGLAQQWIEQSMKAPEDPSWTCQACGHTAEKWSLFCPNCRTIDSFSWDQISSPSPTLPKQQKALSLLNKFLIK
jgi:HemY protein